VNTRIDIVVVELDPTANTIVTKIVSGTAASADPVAPTLTQSATGIYQLPIATLTIPTSTVAITSGMLADTRTFMGNRIGIWTTDTRPANPTAYQTLGYNTTIESHESWNGTAWVGFFNPITTAGDLVVGDETGEPSRLAIGVNETVLKVADGSLVWSALPVANFVVDMNDSTNNTADTGGIKAAGPYSLVFSSEESAFDIYLVSPDGTGVGYSNTLEIVASASFDTVVILGVSNTQKITFSYSGSINDADSAGQEGGAGAYLTSITPTDLPNQDDTATITGGNFSTTVEISFESGEVSLPAKNIVRDSSTQLVVTRPDDLESSLSPWTVRGVNPGIPQPSSSGLNLLVGAVTAGALPAWVSTSPLDAGNLDDAYSDTLEATDAEGAVTYSITSGSLPTGLSLESSTGIISGTPTSAGTTITVLATDEGGNSNSRQFVVPIVAATGGTIVSTPYGITHIFTSSDTFTPLTTLTNVQYLVVAGGGGGGGTNADGEILGRGGGGGGGGYLTSITAETGAGGSSPLSPITSMPASAVAITVGSGGVTKQSGQNSVFAGYATAIGGGAGGSSEGGNQAGVGGSGGGGGRTSTSGASGTSGQGFAGGNYVSVVRYGGGAGGGAGGIGSNGGSSTAPPTAGVTSSATGTAVEYAAGGFGEMLQTPGSGGQSNLYSDGASGKAGIVVVIY
jgi:hypothetical protein